MATGSSVPTYGVVGPLSTSTRFPSARPSLTKTTMAYHSVEDRTRRSGDNLERGVLQPAHKTSCYGSLHDPVLHLRTGLDGLRRRSVQQGWLVHSLRMAQYSTEARCSSKSRRIKRRSPCGRRGEWLICGGTKQWVYMVVQHPRITRPSIRQRAEGGA